MSFRLFNSIKNISTTKFSLKDASTLHLLTSHLLEYTPKIGVIPYVKYKEFEKNKILITYYDSGKLIPSKLKKDGIVYVQIFDNNPNKLTKDFEIIYYKK